MVSDIIILLVLVFFVVAGYRRGLARTLLNLAAVIVASAVGSFLSNQLAQAIYDGFFKQTIINNLQTGITDRGVEAVTSTSLQYAPSWITGMLDTVLKMFGMSINDVQSSIEISKDTSLSIAQQIEQPIGQVSVSVISLILMAVLFTVLMILLKMLIRHLVKVFDLPVITTVNRILGGALGLVEGLVLVLVLVNIMYVVFVNVNPSIVNRSGYFGTVFNFLCFFD